MTLITVILFIIGFILLLAGAELLVRGASTLAESAGISPLVVGLTVVAYGTSAPELAVTVRSVLSSNPQSDLALGNVIGSNISNILLVLGLSAIVAPLSVSRQLVRGSVPLMILTSIGTLALCWNGTLDQMEGLLLFSVAVIYTGYAIYQSRRETAAAMLNREQEEDTSVLTPSQKRKHFGIQIGLMLAGLAMLLIGANWLVEGAVSVAKYFGVGEMIIGLTVVAAGTSLPEIATSIVAALRGQRDIAVGNVVGSNIFNLLLVLGIAGASAPSPIVVSEAARYFDMPFMIAVSVSCLPIFLTQFEISRGEGALFLSYYIGYTTYLFLQATEHDALQPFSTIMFTFVVPITIASLLFTTLRAIRNNRRAKR